MQLIPELARTAADLTVYQLIFPEPLLFELASSYKIFLQSNSSSEEKFSMKPLFHSDNFIFHFHFWWDKAGIFLELEKLCDVRRDRRVIFQFQRLSFSRKIFLILLIDSFLNFLFNQIYYEIHRSSYRRFRGCSCIEYLMNLLISGCHI